MYGSVRQLCNASKDQAIQLSVDGGAATKLANRWKTGKDAKSFRYGNEIRALKAWSGAASLETAPCRLAIGGINRPRKVL